MGLCFVVGGGDTRVLPPPTGPDDLLIAADAGYAPLADRGMVPDLVIGDFDSLGTVPGGVPVQRYPVHKDDTDLSLAIREGQRRGYTRFALYGAAGGARADHTLANLQLLAGLAKSGGRGVLVGDGFAATAIADGDSWRMTQTAGTVSVFCLGDTATGVTLTGLRYPLTDGTLVCTVPLGVSNAFVGGEACVAVRRGTLLIWWETDSTENVLKCLFPAG